MLLEILMHYKWDTYIKIFCTSSIDKTRQDNITIILLAQPTYIYYITVAPLPTQIAPATGKNFKWLLLSLLYQFFPRATVRNTLFRQANKSLFGLSITS